MAKRKVGAKKGRKCTKWGRNSKGRRVCRKWSGSRKGKKR